MKTKLIALLSTCAVFTFGLAFAQSFSWPTPVSTPSPFVGVTPRPTPVPPLPQYFLCFQDWSPTFTLVTPVQCGQGLTLAAGDIVFTGISAGQASTPVGPWPATITLVVNGVKYTSVTVNQTNGMVGSALIVGVQQLEVILPGTGTYQGSSAFVTSH